MLFTLENAKTFNQAETTIDMVQHLLQQHVQLDGLEPIVWTDNSITFHGVTKLTNKSILVTVESTGYIYSKNVQSKEEIAIGRIRL